MVLANLEGMSSVREPVAARTDSRESLVLSGSEISCDPVDSSSEYQACLLTFLARHT